jgi:hypothetical protein
MTSALTASLAASSVNDFVCEPNLEYRTVAGVSGPLVVLEKVRNAKFAEIVNLTLADGTQRRGQVRVTLSVLTRIKRPLVSCVRGEMSVGRAQPPVCTVQVVDRAVVHAVYRKQPP